ncbi:MAG: type II toxin-antitoxin system VapC family toxin [Gemmobacter sp.]
MLDTNIVSDLARHPQGRVVDRIALVGPEAICVSVITAAELLYGGAKKGSPRLLAQIEAILEAIPLLPFGVAEAGEYAVIRLDLEREGNPISANDLLIAAHAVALDAVLVTANTREFGRVRGLAVENWLV